MVGISQHEIVGAGTMPFRDGHTWYRVIGELSADGPPPLVLLHGGPGGVHDALLPLAEMFAGQRPIVLYDQLGCGRSAHRPDWPPEAWTVEAHLAELDALVSHLGQSGLTRFHLLGHSWGGCLAAEYALLRPERLASLTLFSTTASTDLMMASIRALATAIAEQGLPPEEFMARHICRVEMPESLVHTFAQLAEHPEVNAAMAGNDPETGEFVGTLRGWSVVDRLAGISAPALVLGGEFDELDAAARQPFLDGIGNVRGHVFAGASHVAYLETPEEVREVLGGFLAGHD